MSENLYAEKNRILYRQGGESLLMEPWGKNGLRVRACLMHDIEDTNAGLEETDAWPVQIVESKEELRITNGRITACLRLSPWGGPARIRFFNDRDKLLLEEISPEGALRRQAREYKPLNGDNYKLRVSFVSEPEEKIYGMGQYQQEKMNLKGCNLELAHRNSQASVPYYISSLGYGFFWNNPGIGEVHFGLNTTEWIAESTRQMDYWITAEDAPKDLIESYTAVTGRVPRMPEYGLGFWQCKLRYYSQEDVLRVAREYHRRSIPVDMFIIDYFHWPKCGDYRFEEEFFPEPEKMVRELKEMGMETMVSVWPQVDVTGENFGEMSRKGMLVRSRAGVNIQMVHTGYHVFLDATNPETREFVWNKIDQNYVQKGIKAFWLDEAEPEFATYDYANYSYYAGAVEQVGNIYPREFSKLFYEGQEKNGQKDRLNLVRCAWAGSQKYGALVWSGDISCTFEDFRKQICAGLHMGIAGIPWWTTDIGGFAGGWTEDEKFHELLVRWFQFGTFCPVMRMHGSRLPQREVRAADGTMRRGTGADNEIWSFGDEVYEILVEYIHMRERMRPYTRELMGEAHEKGFPAMRAMFLEFPEDEKCWNLTDQYMFGPALLVAPVVHEGARARRVYLPEGESWIDVWTKEEMEGGREVSVDAPLSRIPLFVRKSKGEWIDL